MQRVDQEAVGGVDDLLVAKVEHDDAVVHGRAAPDLLHGVGGVLAIELDPLGDVRGGEDLLDRQLQAAVDQLHHQLVVRDAELAEAAEPGARIHQEAQQDPALGVQDVVDRELGGVGAVDRLHHLDADAREPRRPAEMVVDDPRGGVRMRRHDPVAGVLHHAQLLGGVVVERQRDLGAVGEVRRDVVGGQRDLAVLNVLRMDEQDLVQEPELLEESGADETVEVAAGDEAVGAVRRGRAKIRHGDYVVAAGARA